MGDNQNTVGRIALELGLDLSQLEGQIYGAAKQAEKKAGSAFSGLGKKILAGLGVAAVARFTSSCVNLGSEIAEVQNVVDTAFGNLSNEANSFAKLAVETFGLSELSAKKYMGVFGQMSSAMGLSGQAALEMSKQVTRLTGDVASFYNLSTDEAYTKLKSIWTGETESLKDLGVIMTQANLEQYALNNGFGRTTAKMTEQEKLMLRFQYVTSALSNVTGDFVKTQDGWANQTRVLCLRYEQFKATIGQGFIALFTPIVKGINTILAGLQSLADAFANFTGALMGAEASGGAGLGNVAAGALEAAENITGVGDAAAGTAKKIQKSLMGFDEINKLSGSGSGSGGGETAAPSVPGIDTGGLAAAVAGTEKELSPLTETLKKAFEPFKDISFDNLKASLNGLKQAFEPFTENLFAGLSWAWNEILVPLAKWTIEDLLPAFLDLLAGAIEAVNSAVEALEPLLVVLWDNFLKPVAAWTGGVIVIVLNNLAKALEGLSGWMQNNQGLFDGMIIALGLFAAAWKGIDLAVFIVDAGGVAGALGKLTSKLYECTIAKVKDKVVLAQCCASYAKDFVVSLGKGAAALAQNTLEFAKNFAMAVKNTAAIIARKAAVLACAAAEKLATAATYGFGIAMNILTSPITLVIAALALLAVGIYQLIKNWDSVKEVALYVWECIVDCWDKFAAWFSNLACMAFDGIKAAFCGIGGFFGGVWDTVTGIFGNLADWFRDIFSRAWQGVLDVFSAGGRIFKGIAEGVLSVFKTVVNAIIDGINQVVSIPFDGINAALGGIRDVNILGLKPFEWLPEIPLPKIPRLAEGGYVKANTPQLAMIGDNRTQGEIVAPENKLISTMLQALETFFSKFQNAKSEGDIVIPIYLDGTLLDEVIITAQQRRNMRSGGRA